MVAQLPSAAEALNPVAADLEKVIENIASVAEQSGRRGGAAEVSERLAHVLATPGKRLRPGITLLAARLWDGHDHGPAITMATAVELLHVATLIHDDTVDSAEMRRGRATASNLWGRNVAVLLGDYVFASSAEFVCDTNNIRLIRRFSETIGELARGELTEMLDAGNPNVDRAAYYRRIYDKTASLFSTAAESGAVLGGGTEEAVDLVREYGCNLGMAFQIMDDILDFEATSAEFGKPISHDLAGGVLTLPAIMLMERSPAANALTRLMAGNGVERKRDLADAVGEVRSSGVLEEARIVARQHIDRARRAMTALPPSESRNCLLALADFVCDRRS